MTNGGHKEFNDPWEKHLIRCNTNQMYCDGVYLLIKD